MADLGTVYTDKQIAKVEKRINAVYSEAARDIEQKMNDFTERHKVKAAKYAQQVADGKITKAQYDAWMRGQVFQGKQWQAKRDQILGVIHDSNGVAARMVSGSTYGVFSFNSNYMAYRIERKAGVNFGFGLYDTATVTRMIKGEPQLLPKYNLNKAKDYIWNEKKLNNAVTQGIIQGESLDDISERIAESLSTQNNNTMKTFARTAMTGAQNAGRLMRMHEAKSLGINVKKQWMATLDGHTRDTHADIDGEVQELDSHGRELPFSNGCLFPGDPNGAPAEVYNCRCTLDEMFEDYPSEYKRYDNIDGKPIENMTYREWEAGKKAEAAKTKQPEKGVSSRGYIYGEPVYLMVTNDATGEIEEHTYTVTRQDDYGFTDGTSSGVYQRRTAEIYTADDGTRFIYPADLDESKQGESPEDMLERWYQAPKEFREKIQKEVVVVDYRNPRDSYWEKEYGMKDFRSYATGGTDITFYACEHHDQKYIVRTFYHEGGHFIDIRRDGFDFSRVSESAEWQTAMENDFKVSGKKSVTSYGGAHVHEDFAESIAEYMEHREEMVLHFPNRCKIISELLGF